MKQGTEEWERSFSLFGNGYFFAKFPLLYMNASATLPEAVKRVYIIGMF
ncbi:hypothetical protein [Prevotella nigrescens]|nr:hypothetical protein [Prevotella nigrescens]EGQ17099.1 hypothetical protein HMPREF9419_0452 [Prevotella nigrescens ATCC 33563]MBF1457495.1 hypothetical protein [Prevotella nigrescens]UAK27654.1 hypothetical protein K8O81_04450 [Prevotella nigrescens]WMS21608.1 hypothetical protein RDV52_09070 [Prevotella nigrescens]